MQNRLYLFPALIAALLAGGCEKYVDIKTQGKLVPGQAQNYRLILNASNTFEPGAAVGDFAADDVQLVDGSPQQVALASSAYYGYWGASYSWQTVIYPLAGFYYQDGNWNNLYNSVTNANVVIAEVPAVTDADAATKNGMIGEALVHRADAYLQLVNTYAKPYDSATASTDGGVPLVLTETTTQPLNRASISAVYDQIIRDLKAATPILPTTQSYNTLPSLVSAYGELARCYFYMGRYDSANHYADSALYYRSTLDDLSTITNLNSSTYPLRVKDPEVLLSKTAYTGISAYSPTAIRLSDTLLSVLTTTDQRYLLFTTAASTISSSYTAAGGRFFYKDRALGESRNIGPSVPEMMLIKAEYYARSGNATAAMNWVNQLRIKRFKPANYIALTATDANDALLKTLQERQREFFCRLLRWWDMRRLKSDSRFQRTLTRSFGGQSYTLTANDNRYVFPISPYNLKLNPEIGQNP